MFFCPQRDHCCFRLLINSLQCLQGFPAAWISPWTCAPAEVLCLGILGSLQSELPDFTLCQDIFLTFEQYRKYGWASAYMWKAESPFLLFLLRLSLAGNTGSLGATPDSQSSRVCTLSLIWMHVGWLLLPPSLLWRDPPEVARFKPGLELFTSVVRTGETGIVEVMASSGQSSLCVSFSLPQFSEESNKNLPRLVLPSLSGLSCISQFATAVPNSWQFSKLRWFFSFAEQGNTSPSDIFTASTSEQELMPCLCLCRPELLSHHHWLNIQW